jgi:hypothetical protein
MDKFIVRDEVISIDGTPHRRLMVYRIDYDLGLGDVDLINIATTYNINSLVVKVLDDRGFPEDAAYAILDMAEKMLIGTLHIRQGTGGQATIEYPPVPVGQLGPSKLRLELVHGLRTFGMVRIEIGLSGPANMSIDESGGVGGSAPPADIILDYTGSPSDFYEGYSAGYGSPAASPLPGSIEQLP